jgi:hypothetical protein
MVKRVTKRDVSYSRVSNYTARTQSVSYDAEHESSM